jgi:hypothetical protein
MILNQNMVNDVLTSLFGALNRADGLVVCASTYQEILNTSNPATKAARAGGHKARD